ncbi:protein trichome birefringence-like 9 [Macadamia integrifolia]|uniref:protein trichome birefringence-like 9 n=1 Tax=Macadamia integrifolia TaxID=60698 RepID=UPI001C4E7F1D|nr:protein trichome birefringence-like 9 [Macadamia integrifolia]
METQPHQPSHQPILQKIHDLFSIPLPIFVVKREVTYTLSFLLLFSFLLFLDLIHFFHPQSLLYIGFLSQVLPSYNQTSSSPKICDYSIGRWLSDDDRSRHELYTEGCPFLDPGFRCHENGRTDYDYLKWRWQPDGCDLPRFNASELLERSRNGRIVFAGDSIGRNQWESLVCMLSQAVTNKSTIYEQNGSPITKHKGYLIIRFHEYNLTVEYYRVPFLVILDRPPQNSSVQIKHAIRVDQLHWYSQRWVGANVLVFNAGHWWNADKTVKTGSYFQEGRTVNMTMDVKEAFRRSLSTWKSWVIENLDPETSYIFFRSYSPSHFRDQKWDEGGHCDTASAPETNYTKLESKPWNNQCISQTIEQINDAKRNIQFLNITYLTGFRIDGHPSIHREPGTPLPIVQDCSHWCLPGVPDTWNELLYGHLLSKGFRTTKRKTNS